jgi:transglutaminase-like putative cysteine protease
MVSVASAMLWITQQLDLWAVALQASALLASLRWRHHPHAWQRNFWALNLGMLGISLATIAVALRGEPSIIALAHFAALTQGLQLLDARPRRTEFLLTALALFQVVLAANLTDSVFFTPLLVAFVFATAWTLLVHTLHSEALEAGETREISRAITPGLLRTTLFVSGLSVLLAMLLFVMLPRLRTSAFTGPQTGGPLPTAGFSDTVAFGELGRIRQDSSTVLRVETLEGEPPNLGSAYWRGLAFDTFDGASWSVTPPDRYRITGSAEGGVRVGRGGDSANLVQRIVREPVAAGVLFAVGEPRELHGTVRRLERDLSGGLYAAGQAAARVRYTVRSQTSRWRDAELRRDRAAPPPRRGARYLQLPDLSDEVHALARQIAKNAATDAERVRALERHLLENGRYLDTPSALDPSAQYSPVEAFLLGDLAGHCEYFASGMVLLARTLGIPARLLNGFAGGRENRIGGFVELTRSDAHTWVEVHYARAGWVRYDPTPPDLRMRQQADLPLAARLRELGSALELWWFQRVVGFDRADQIGALRHVWLAWQETRALTPGHKRQGAEPRERLELRRPSTRSVALLLCSGIAAAILWHWRRRARHAVRAPASYQRALRLLARRGLVRAPATPARAFAAQVRTRVPPQTARAFSALTEAYLAARFGGRPERDASAWLRTMRRGLRRRANTRGAALT